METAASMPHILQYDQIASLISEITCAKSSSLAFIKGFVLGQLSVIVVVVLVLRYLFTEDVKRVNKVIAMKLHGLCRLMPAVSAIFHRDCRRHHPHEQLFRYRMITLHRKRTTI